MVTRQDLSPGYRAVQSTHAAINFIFENPSRAGPWFRDSNYLVLLEVLNEKQLKLLSRKCEELRIVHTVFREPDIGNQVTAVALEPSLLTKKLVAKIPLLFKNETDNNSPENNGHQSTSIQPNQNSTLQKEA